MLISTLCRLHMIWWCYLNFFFNFFSSSRKWLPPPLRKLSQGKVEKGQNATAPDRPPLKKTGSDKRFKVCTSQENERKRILISTTRVPLYIVYMYVLQRISFSSLKKHFKTESSHRNTRSHHGFFLKFFFFLLTTMKS